MGEKKKTSIKIDSEVWKEAKKMAIDEETTVGQFVEQMLREKAEVKG